MTNLNVMAGLGVMIAGAEVNPITPEKALVMSFDAAKNDLGGLILIHTWTFKNHDLIHTESLLNELKLNPEVLKLVAGALFYTGEKRFGKIYDLAIESTVFPKLGKLLNFAVEIGQSPQMDCYSRFGLKITDFKLEADRKFKTREGMIKSNPFFFCRALFGSNWRADVAACFLIKVDKNPTVIKKFLNCSYETSYRNYNSLVSVGWNENIQKSFDIN